jgi:hypothetical protein
VVQTFKSAGREHGHDIQKPPSWVAVIVEVLFCRVGRVGLEPTRLLRQKILSLPRLPLRHRPMPYLHTLLANNFMGFSLSSSALTVNGILWCTFLIPIRYTWPAIQTDNKPNSNWRISPFVLCWSYVEHTFPPISLSVQLGVLCVLAVQLYLWICIFSGLLPHIHCCTCDICDAADTREPTAALSDISRASRLPFVSIQRLAPVVPPAISAGNRHKLHFVS